MAVEGLALSSTSSKDRFVADVSVDQRLKVEIEDSLAPETPSTVVATPSTGTDSTSGASVCCPSDVQDASASALPPPRQRLFPALEDKQAAAAEAAAAAAKQADESHGWASDASLHVDGPGQRTSRQARLHRDASEERHEQTRRQHALLRQQVAGLVFQDEQRSTLTPRRRLARESVALEDSGATIDTPRRKSPARPAARPASPPATARPASPRPASPRVRPPAASPNQRPASPRGAVQRSSSQPLQSPRWRTIGRAGPLPLSGIVVNTLGNSTPSNSARRLPPKACTSPKESASPSMQRVPRRPLEQQNQEESSRSLEVLSPKRLSTCSLGLCSSNCLEDLEDEILERVQAKQLMAKEEADDLRELRAKLRQLTAVDNKEVRQQAIDEMHVREAKDLEDKQHLVKNVIADRVQVPLAQAAVLEERRRKGSEGRQERVEHEESIRHDGEVHLQQRQTIVEAIRDLERKSLVIQSERKEEEIEARRHEMALHREKIREELEKQQVAHSEALEEQRIHRAEATSRHFEEVLACARQFIEARREERKLTQSFYKRSRSAEDRGSLMAVEAREKAGMEIISRLENRRTSLNIMHRQLQETFMLRSASESSNLLTPRRGTMGSAASMERMDSHARSFVSEAGGSGTLLLALECGDRSGQGDNAEDQDQTPHTTVGSDCLACGDSSSTTDIVTGRCNASEVCSPRSSVKDASTLRHPSVLAAGGTLRTPRRSRGSSQSSFRSLAAPQQFRPSQASAAARGSCSSSSSYAMSSSFSGNYTPAPSFTFSVRSSTKPRVPSSRQSLGRK